MKLTAECVKKMTMPEREKERDEKLEVNKNEKERDKDTYNIDRK